MYDDFFYLLSSIDKDNKELEKEIQKLDELDRKSIITPEAVKTRKEEQRQERIQKENAEKKERLAIRETEKQLDEAIKNLKKSRKEDFEKIEKIEKVEKPIISIDDFYKRVDNTSLTDESKMVLKKMIEYAKKFNEGLVKNYIPFNMRIYSDNNDTLYEILNIIIDSFSNFKYIKNTEAVERSFYVVEESAHITDLYNTVNSIVIFKDVEGILSKDKPTKDKFLNAWKTEIFNSSNKKGITTIVVSKTKEKVDELFANDLVLKDKIFDFELSTTNKNVDEIYDSILTKLKKDYIVTANFEIKLKEYIKQTYPKATIPGPDFISHTIEKILFNKSKDIIDEETLPKYDKPKTIDDVFKDLNELVGLNNIKSMLKDLVSLIKFKKKTGDALKLKDTNLHMVFLGNPGTGKTTVARMIAEILYNLDYIKQNKLIEVSAKDLIGQYVGQTAPKTMEVVEKALGGVLFIDEAYALAAKPGGNSSSFNEECIATLIQAMENYRDNLVVIFAGYSKEMDAFLKSNSGIISRIGYTMHFNDYTIDELIEIFKIMLKKSGFTIEDSAIDKAKEIIEEFSHTEGFGNARFVRNLYEKTVIKHATNTASESDINKLKTITSDDISKDNLSKL